MSLEIVLNSVATERDNMEMMETFIWKHSGKVVYGVFSHFENAGGYTHGFSTRMGGVSTGCFSSMNLAYNSNDQAERVSTNYRIFTLTLGVKLENAVLSHQTHHTNILKVKAADRGKGFNRDRDYKSIDGLITNEPDTPLMTFHADCVPLLFIDPVTNAIGLAHAGWKGTAQNLAGKMVSEMEVAYGTKPSDLLVGIGPSIAECCFIIRDDVRQIFLKEMLFSESLIRGVNKNQWKISLQNINRELLVRSGVNGLNIVESGVCTCCQSDLLFSHRAQGNNRGTMTALLQINDNK